MPDLRELMEDLVAQPVAAGPSVEEIGRRAGRRRARRRRTLALGVAVVVAAGPLRWAVSSPDDPVKVASKPGREDPAPPPASPPSSEPSATSDDAPPTPGDGSSPSGAPAGSSRQPEPGARLDLQCKAGYNGGATDHGVTGSRINIHMRATLDGPRKSLVEEAPITVKKAVDEVNRHGGICGRLVSVMVVNDTEGESWHRPVDGFVAGLVGPLQAGFEEHIADGTVDRAGLPLVGTDGFTEAQYRSELVWPVGTSAAALARIAVDHAYRTVGARTFAMAYDSTFSWSKEAETAFRAQVARLPGASVRITTGLDPRRPSYASEAEEYRRSCGEGRCDMLLLALLPDTAAKWLKADAELGRLQTAGLPFLLNDRFAEDCVTYSITPCDRGLRVWTGFVAENPNPMVASTEVGVRVLIEALKRVGPNLTRKHLQEALAEMTYPSNLADTLDWNPVTPGPRGGNTSARAYDARQGAFHDAGTGWARDPLPD